MDPSPPWLRYAAFSRGLVGLGDRESPEDLRRASVASPRLQGLLGELRAWPGRPLASHRSAEQLFHKLALAADLGLRRGDQGADEVSAQVMGSVSAEGPFGLPMRIEADHGGSGAEVLAWALCDAPVILRAFLVMGWGGDPRIERAIDYLASLTLERGYPCAVSASLGAWRGPGRRGDPCPYATLVMLELLLEAGGRTALVLSASECLLRLWERSHEEHPYIFWMGNDFRKLKAPLIWYDLLHVLEALSKVKTLRGDPRFESMLDVLEAKRGGDGGFTPESVYRCWNAEDFGQKKRPSGYVTALAQGILARSGRLPAVR